MKKAATIYLNQSLHEAVRNHVAVTGEFLGPWVVSAAEAFLLKPELKEAPDAFPLVERSSAKMVKIHAEDSLILQINESAKNCGVTRNSWINEAAKEKLTKERSFSDDSVWKHQVGKIRKSSTKKNEVQLHLTEELYNLVKHLADKRKVKRAGWITESLAEFYRDLEFKQLIEQPIKFPGKRFTTTVLLENDFLKVIEQQIKRAKKVRPAFSLSAFARLSIQHKLNKEALKGHNASPETSLNTSSTSRSGKKTFKKFVEQFLFKV